VLTFLGNPLLKISKCIPSWLKSQNCKGMFHQLTQTYRLIVGIQRPSIFYAAAYYCDPCRPDDAKREGGEFHCITDLTGQKTRSNPYIFGIVCGLNHCTAATVCAWKRICSYATKITLLCTQCGKCEPSCAVSVALQ
jgi:hypothetical protein